MSGSVPAGGARALGVGSDHTASLGRTRGQDWAGGRPTPEVKVASEGGRPPRLGGDMATFEEMGMFFVDYSEIECSRKVRAGRFSHPDDGSRGNLRRKALNSSLRG